eukprot:TRINITY_DN11869_c0_g1_i1.p1 TRINITY_DN11869_c0_g1~~TRINITY_DN11869_c0_g1_i1.p1  ORF type:complete len:412 (+),score=40.38 TRINITY_DN11869_c0_g1_i1:60-1295(+)
MSFALPPLGTTVLLLINILLFVFTIIYPDYIGSWVISAYAVFVDHEYYQLFTSAFLHGNIAHLLLNMLTLFYVGPQIENLFGTIAFCGICFLLVFFGNCLFVLAYCANVFLLRNTDWGPPTLGFSGVLFGFICIECALDPPELQRSVFGFCRVPSWLYPWMLLIVLQIIFPGVSFMGHLAGIVIGFAYVKGLFNWFSLPRCLLVRVEELCCCPAASNYIYGSISNTNTNTSNNTDNGGGGGGKYIRIAREHPLSASQLPFTRTSFSTIWDNMTSCFSSIRRRFSRNESNVGYVLGQSSESVERNAQIRTEMSSSLSSNVDSTLEHVEGEDTVSLLADETAHSQLSQLSHSVAIGHDIIPRGSSSPSSLNSSSHVHMPMAAHVQKVSPLVDRVEREARAAILKASDLGHETV